MSQNYEGPRTVYGDAYHGYWIADVTKLNDRFGTADDLKALSDELHRRGMCVSRMGCIYAISKSAAGTSWSMSS